MSAGDVARMIAAARAAIEELPPRGIIGLGSGRAARAFVEAVAEARGRGSAWSCVATSRATRALAESLGVPLLPDEGPWAIDVTVDGADEVSEALDLLKGGGGAHTREKIVSYASARNVILVDESKLSRRLGEKRALPVELVPFGARETARRLEAFGACSVRPEVSDNGNVLVDVATGPIDDPGALDRALSAVPGVVSTGLFVGRADLVLVARADGVVRLTKTP